MTSVRRGAVVVLFVFIVSLVPALAQQAGTRNREASPEVSYDLVRTLTPSDVKLVYAEMPAYERQELWTAHLLTFLAEHPELDEPQRAVVLQALGLVRTGIFAIDPQSPRYRTAVQAPLDRIIASARALLPRELVVQAFFTIGTPAPRSGRETGAGRAPWSVRTNTYNCECATPYVWCPDEARECVTDSFCAAVRSYDCGPFFVYACDGMCV
jgi:hypothetical protein